jgi:hypothetical protein
MAVINILIFFASSILVFLLALYIYLVFYNRRTMELRDKFLKQAGKFNPTIIKNIKLRYWITIGLRTQTSPNNHCDLYLFDNCLAIVRRQDFIFKVLFAPVFLAADVLVTKSNFNFADIYKPDHVTFKQILKDEVDIKLTDPKYKHCTIEITFKGLTKEQINELERIKNWS